jgi:hypothetical protein
MHHFEGETLINRMNRTQASIYHLGAAATGDARRFFSFTDVTESTLFVSLFGPRTFRSPRS